MLPLKNPVNHPKNDNQHTGQHKPGRNNIREIGFRDPFHQKDIQTVLDKPGNQQNNEIERGHVLENVIENFRNSDVGAADDFFPGLFRAENPEKDDDLNHRESHHAKSSGPEIKFVQKTVLQEKNDRKAEGKQDTAAPPSRLFSVNLKFLLQKGHQRLDNRHRAGHRRQKKEKKPDAAEQLTPGHFLENNRQSLKTQIKRPPFGNGGGGNHAEKGHRHRNGNGAAADHLSELVGHRRGEAV